MISADKHIATIELVADGLKDLLEQVSFVGGATVVLYINEVGFDPKLRATEDIDFVIEITTYEEFTKLEKRLRKLGFLNCQEPESPMCRFVYQGVKVDVMPTEENVLQFSNQWYKSGLANAEKIKLPSGKEIFIFSFSYFLAAKTEAFFNRGKNDFYGSKDLEDIITVLSGRTDIRKDLYEAPEEIKVFVRNNFGEIIEDESFIQSISGHLAAYSDSETRAQEVLDLLQSI